MNISPTTEQQKKKRIGRGGRRGKTSGRGHKGQGQHGSHGLRPEWRDIIQRIPKLRGWKMHSIQDKPFVLNVSDLEQAFEKGDTVNPQTLVEKSLIRNRQSVTKTVKILGHGDLTKKLTIENCLVSESAKEKITKAGGTVKA